LPISPCSFTRAHARPAAALRACRARRPPPHALRSMQSAVHSRTRIHSETCRSSSATTHV